MPKSTKYSRLAKQLRQIRLSKLSRLKFQRNVQGRKKLKFNEKSIRTWLTVLISLLALLFVHRQNKIMEDQTRIYESQSKILENQNILVETQNKLIDRQVKRIDQQTNLQEAERRSSIVYLFSNVLDKIDEELKLPHNRSRKLSTELISRIASLTYALKPYKYLDNDTIINKAVSPEKGQLLAALINFNLDSSSYKEIFLKSNFQNTELINPVLPNARFVRINLAHSIIRNSNLNNAVFFDSHLENVIFDGSHINNALFKNCYLRDASFKNVQGDGAKFIRNVMENVDYGNANLNNSTFYSGDLWEYEWGQVITGKHDPNRIDNLKKLKSNEDFGLLLFKSANYNLTDKSSGQESSFYHHASLKLNNKQEKKGNTIKILGPITFIYASMKEVNFQNTNLSNALISNYNLKESNFNNAVLMNVDFKNCVVEETYFNESRIDSITFVKEFHESETYIRLADFYKLVPHDVKKGFSEENYSNNSGQVWSFDLNELEPYPYHLELINSYTNEELSEINLKDGNRTN